VDDWGKEERRRGEERRRIERWDECER